MSRKLEYINEGRSGNVIYSDGNIEFKMYYEFGSGECAAIVNIPSVEEWKKVTDSPLSLRSEILNFVADQIVKEKTTNGYFKLADNFIEIYK